MDDTKTYSLNDTVYYQVTESGRKVMIENLDELYGHMKDRGVSWRPSLKEPWRIDYIDGGSVEWYKDQLHHVFQEFGGGDLRLGCILPVTNIAFDEPPDPKETYADE